MSLINDALKRAQQAPPVVASAAQPPAPPTAAPQNPVSVIGWLIPAIVIFLVMAAVFFIGWGMAHHSLSEPDAVKIAEVQPLATTAPSAAAPVGEQAASPAPTFVPAPANSPAPEPVNPLLAPKLQGIFYSPTDPTAILDGRTVHKGDRFKKYRVKDITASAVTLVDAGNNAIKVVMGN